MTPEVAATLVDSFADPLKDMLVAAVVALLAALTRWALAHTKSHNVQAALEQLDHVAEVAVRQVAQTYVDQIKAQSADGHLSAAEAHLALARATDLVKDSLGKAWEERTKKALKADDVSTLVVAHVEAAVHRVNGESGTTVSAGTTDG